MQSTLITPEQLLATVVRDLYGPTVRQFDALLLLLRRGPYLISRERLALIAGARLEPNTIALLAEQLLGFLGAFIAWPTDAANGIGHEHPIGYIPHREGARVRIEIDVLGLLVETADGIRPDTSAPAIAARLREFAIAQLVGLLQLTGISRLRLCQAPKQQSTCDRVFVRTGKQEFCSAVCRKRSAMRAFRARARAAAERQEQLRQRRRRRPS